MENIKRWSGNLTSQVAIWRTEAWDLINFCQTHERIYVFGNGKIGKAVQFYLSQSEIKIVNSIASDNINQLRDSYVKNSTGIVLGLSSDYYHEILPVLLSFASVSDVCFLPESLKRQFEQHLSLDEVQKNFWIDIFTTTRCNLNCKGCSVFAPVCSPEDYEFEQFVSDITRIKSLNFECFNQLKFTGGEALLNNNIFVMFQFTREMFPTHNIECYTNGILLNRLSEENIKNLKRHNIRLTVTEYPLAKLNLEQFNQIAASYQLPVSYIYHEGEKLFCKYKLNLNKDTPKHYFFGCPRHSVFHSLFLYNGHFYKCPRAITSEQFSNAFHVPYQIEQGDRLDISTITSTEDVYKFCMVRKSFCGYCSPITELVPWAISERKIEEWT